MALIRCPECGESVSSIAAACPHCGAPVAGAREARAAGAPLTTIQQTTKKLKAWSAVGVVVSFIGFAWLALNYYGPHRGASGEQGSFMTTVRGPAVLIVSGILWSIVMRIRIWWHHG